MKYTTGEPVLLGDIVDVNEGNGPQCRVVVIIPSGEAESGFVASEWSYLKHGVMLQDTKVLGLLHLDELSPEHILVRRAQQTIPADRGEERRSR
jgi:hypothetical protein